MVHAPRRRVNDGCSCFQLAWRIASRWCWMVFVRVWPCLTNKMVNSLERPQRPHFAGMGYTFQVLLGWNWVNFEQGCSAGSLQQKSVFSWPSEEPKAATHPSQIRATDPIGQYIQYLDDGGMVRKNAPGAIWAHGNANWSF